MRGTSLLFSALALASSAGCYAPDLRDCTVTCASASDCAGGQVCGADGFCAASDVAGHCGTGALDAGPDAPGVTKVALHVQVMGAGKIVVGGVGECSTEGPTHGDCVLQAPLAPISMQAVQITENKEFERWMTPLCPATTNPTCSFTLTMPATVAAKFK